MAVDAAFKLKAAVAGPTVVKGEDDVALLRHVLQKPSAGKPVVGHELGMGAAIDIVEHRIFLCAVEQRRKNHAAVQVIIVTVLQREDAGLRHHIGAQVVLVVQKNLADRTLPVAEQIARFLADAAAYIKEPGACRVRLHAVRAVFRCDSGYFPLFHIQHEEAVSGNLILVGGEIELLPFRVKPFERLDLPFA